MEIHVEINFVRENHAFSRRCETIEFAYSPSYRFIIE